ncbi:NADH-quinone oxidoreductase subunit NuoG [Congregibacter sp.]|jgi:NADH-quinone oxidoreductase subunit G|uniref:NADH-quinone oxidoreductase subunit NuoG n=1 Tax=Congregibacter sp. TaxID=2744308 RepID=UPI0039E377F3
MATIHIDGVAYEVEAGKNLLETCLSLGLNLPYFCWHPAMGSIGACRQCAVVQYQNAEDQHGRIVMGCMTQVSDGALFSLSGDKAGEFRKAIVESLMINHPHDCPVCGEGGECHLQDMTVMVGHRDRQYRGQKRTHRNQYLGPLIEHEMNRCITCYRCTRFYRDYAGGEDLAALGAHDHIYFGRQNDGVLESEFAGNLVEVCPTGVFTDKTLVNQYTRKWDLQSAPSVCTGCAYGCNTMPGERYGKLKRVHNRFNAAVNGYFLCDRGRFGAAYVNQDSRLEHTGLRNAQGKYDALDSATALEHLQRLGSTGRLGAIGSPRASVESNYLLRAIAGADNFAPGFSVQEQSLVHRALDLQRRCTASTPDLDALEGADAILILAEDVTQSAPRLALALRQSVRNKAYEMAADLGLQPWQDAAVRNLAQNQRSPMFIVTAGDTRLDDVAEARASLDPAGIAAFGFAVAKRLRSSSERMGDENIDTLVASTADALRAAKRPLIVSGTSCGDPACMDAAAQIAEALCELHQPAMLSLVVPEANSLGLAMLVGENAPDLDALRERAQAGELDTLVILENDLYRRGSRAQIDELLGAFATVIAIDGMDNATTSAAAFVLPAASPLEGEGTLVSMEGRAQRHFPVFAPAADRQPAWRWLRALAESRGLDDLAALQHFDDLMHACAAAEPALAAMVNAAPDHDYRSLGLKIPRQPQRYSGRTAMRANVSVHEPKQPTDEETALSYTMEGLNRDEPGSLLPFVWSPGWNSNQSLHKFQAEVGGPIRGGSAGVRLLPDTPIAQLPAPTAAAAAIDHDQWRLVPRPQIFGSDELSALSPGVSELVKPGFVEIDPAAATLLRVTAGDGLVVGDSLATLEVKVNPLMPAGCVGYSAGVAGCEGLIPMAAVTLTRAADWVRPSSAAQVIGSDRVQHV